MSTATHWFSVFGAVMAGVAAELESIETETWLGIGYDSRAR